jgi:hypothetical protein
MSTTADTSGTTAPPPADGAVEPAPATFTLGQLVRHTWEDPYHAEPQTRYGLVVAVPTEGNADVPEAEQTKSYEIAWCEPGTAALEADALEAV